MLPVMLPTDVVAVVLSHASLPTIGCAGRVCHDWLAASRSEDLGLVVLRRRWQFAPEHLMPDASCNATKPLPALTAPFESWWKLLRALTRLDDYFVDLRRLRGVCETIHHGRLGSIVGRHFVAALDRLDREVQEFVIGMVAGFMPAEGGIFTYQGPRATPIHYRHIQDTATVPVASTVPSVAASAGGNPQQCSVHVTPNNGVARLDHGPVLVGRYGGRWEWSTDRLTWSSTATDTIPEESLFGRRQYVLAAQNRQLVRFLQEYPVMPLFCSPIPLAIGAAGDGRFPRSVDDYFWVSSHGGVCSHNRMQLDTFKQRILTHAPTMPCVTSRLLTIHQLLQPPIMIRVDQPAEAVIPRLPIELRQAMQSVRPYAVARRQEIAADVTLLSTEIWRTWSVIRLADRKVRAAVLASPDLDHSLPEDADGGFVVEIAPA